MKKATLPDDIELLKQMIVERDARLDTLQGKLTAKEQEGELLTLLIEKLKLQIARFKRAQFGRSSEQLAQLELLVCVFRRMSVQHSG